VQTERKAAQIALALAEALRTESLDGAEVRALVEGMASRISSLEAQLETVRRTLEDAVPGTMLTAKSVAKVLNCTERHVWTLRSRGELPEGRKVGNKRMWRHDEVVGL